MLIITYPVDDDFLCSPLVLVANLVSLPVVWFVFPTLKLDSAINVALAELFAVMFEAVFLYVTNRPQRLSLGRAAALSLLMNAASFVLGLPIVTG